MLGHDAMLKYILKEFDDLLEQCDGEWIPGYRFWCKLIAACSFVRLRINWIPRVRLR